MSRLSTKDILNMNLEEGNTRTRKSTEYSEKESKKSNLALNLESVYEQSNYKEEMDELFDDHLVSKLRGALAAGVTVNAVLEARNEKDFDEE